MTQERVYSWVNPNLCEKESSLGGWGTFAKNSIDKDDLLIIFGGYVMNIKEEQGLSPEIADIGIQIDRDYIISPFHRVLKNNGDYVNHSCDPNAGIRGQISLYAMRTIPAGEEITFDYGTVLFGNATEIGYSLACNCGTSHCRKNVTDLDWKIKALQDKYGKYFPFYILDEINTQK